MRRLISLILVFLTLAGGAQAAFSPTAESLKEGAEWRASVRLDALAPLGETSLSVVNAWLNGAEIVVTEREEKDASRSRIRLTVDDAALIDVVSLYRKDYSLTAFARDDGRYEAYLTGAGCRDALTLLTDGGLSPVAPDALIEAFMVGAKEMYALLGNVVTPKEVKSSTSIKNAGTSSQYVEYKLTAEQMNGVWLKLVDAMLPCFDAALLSAPDAAARAREFLIALTFSGECRFKRMLNKAGEDIGLQFTARAASGGDERKVTLFGGFAEGAGLYMSLSLPAVKGKNNLKLTVSCKLTEKKTVNTLATEITYTNTLDGATETANLTSSLKNNLTDGESITGKITLTTKKNGVKSVYTAEPALTSAGDGELTGTVAFQRKTDGEVDAKGTVALSYGGITANDDVAENIADTLDLTGKTDDAASAALAGEKAALLSRFVRLIAALPEAERTLLTHEMRTEAWMTAPDVSVETAPEAYRVTEEE